MADAPRAPTLYTVAEDTVGRSQSFPVTAAWSTTPLPVVASAGIVTSIMVADGDMVDVGAVLYGVDLRPLTVASGVIPAFREMKETSVGDDVSQLQQFLIDRGYLHGSATGTFTVDTADAVRAWQSAAGYPVDGVVHLGDLAFIPHLPTRVVLDDGLRVGMPTPSGVPIASAVVGNPTFTVRLDGSQQAVVPHSGSVIVTDDNGAYWQGAIGRAETTTDGLFMLTLEGTDGSAIRGLDCDAVPVVDGGVIYTAELTVVPPRTGPTVPVSALQIDASGATFVETPDGTRVPVTVRAQARGLAVINGIQIGAQVRLSTAAGADSGAGTGGTPTK